MPVKNNVKVPCVFVHGWAMNSAVWDCCLSCLPDWIDVIRLDLPGHGDQAATRAACLDDYAKALRAQVDRPAVWVGWSLGGLAVMRLAELYPAQVSGLLLVASNPCFVSRPGWPSGVEAAVFDGFGDALERDVDATLRRFLALQARGADNAKQTVRALQQALLQRGRAGIDALRLGLDILAGSDLRQQVSALQCPTRWILGARDTLVPATLQEALHKLNPGIDVIVEEQAAHAPFISQPQQFCDALAAFVSELNTESPASKP